MKLYTSWRVSLGVNKADSGGGSHAREISRMPTVRASSLAVLQQLLKLSSLVLDVLRAEQLRLEVCPEFVFHFCLGHPRPLLANLLQIHGRCARQETKAGDQNENCGGTTPTMGDEVLYDHFPPQKKKKIVTKTKEKDAKKNDVRPLLML